MSTAFGYQSRTTSPWRQRIDAAGRAFMQSKTERVSTDHLIDSFRTITIRKFPDATGWDIFRRVCETHGFRPWEVRSTRRSPLLVACRAEAAQTLRTEGNLPYEEIGRIINRDTSTVVYLLRSRGLPADAVKRTPQQFCKRGHPLSGINLHMTKEGKRRCKRCTAYWKYVAYQKKRAARREAIKEELRRLPAREERA